MSFSFKDLWKSGSVPEVGQRVKGLVVAEKGAFFVVDVSLKSEGLVPKEEFAGENVKIGDWVEVLLESKEDKNGNVVLSRDKAKKDLLWDKFEKMDKEETVKGKIISKTQNGYRVIIGDANGNINGFLPGSLSGLKGLSEADAFDLVGSEQLFTILQVDKENNNLLLTRKQVLSKSRDKAIASFLEKYKQGDVVEATVKNVVDYGVFFDIEGVDALLHSMDISWERKKGLEWVGMFKPGERMKTKIIKISNDVDQGKRSFKISLGLKQLEYDPWDNIHEHYSTGMQCVGKIENIASCGVFIELGSGIGGLARYLDVHNKRGRSLTVGDQVNVTIGEIDEKERSIRLVVQNNFSEDWKKIEQNLKVGDMVKGVISSCAEFGIFINVFPGIDGFVKTTDIARNKSEGAAKYKEGDVVEAKILVLDAAKEKLQLSIKQAENEMERGDIIALTVGQEIKVKVERILDGGVIVEIAENFSGFVKNSELSKKTKSSLQEGEQMVVRITAIDPDVRRLSLSAKFAEHIPV